MHITHLKIYMKIRFYVICIQDIFTNYDTDSWPEDIKKNVSILSNEEKVTIM
jgi:hypothetical protein